MLFVILTSFTVGHWGGMQAHLYFASQFIREFSGTEHVDSISEEDL
jgi:hypothetical protein